MVTRDAPPEDGLEDDVDQRQRDQHRQPGAGSIGVDLPVDAGFQISDFGSRIFHRAPKVQDSGYRFRGIPNSKSPIQSRARGQPGFDTVTIYWQMVRNTADRPAHKAHRILCSDVLVRATVSRISFRSGASSWLELNLRATSKYNPSTESKTRSPSVPQSSPHLG